MRTIIKKITSLFFILLGFAPLLFVIVITIRKHDIHKRMKEKIETHQLQTVSIPENEVTWMDKHEIWVNNSMFDIHSKKLENGIYTFTGLYDEEETELVVMERNAAGENKDQNKLLAEFFENLPVFCTQAIEISESVIPYTSFDSFNSLNSANPFREIITPPPQL